MAYELIEVLDGLGGTQVAPCRNNSLLQYGAYGIARYVNQYSR